MKFRIILISLAALIAACGKEVGFETLETARTQARDNAEFNVRKWRADTKVAADLDIMSRGDSTQSPDCPQGDGWASVKLVNKDGQEQASLKCSTVSASVGCLLEQDFRKSPYSNDDGSCQPMAKVPHPLPKIAK